MKKKLSMIIIFALSLALTACSTEAENETAGVGEENATVAESGNTEPVKNEEINQTEEIESEQEEKGSHILVAYFSYADNAELPEGIDASSSASVQAWGDEITGNTGVVAHMISESVGADLFSIKTVNPYPPTYDGAVEQGQQEKDEEARPELADHIDNLENYDTIFVGFPTWWYDMPMAMYSFFDEYDFSGKTIYMFCTSGGSGFLNTTEKVQELEPDAQVIEGLSIGASSAMNAEEQIQSWIAELEL